MQLAKKLTPSFLRLMLLKSAVLNRGFDKLVHQRMGWIKRGGCTLRHVRHLYTAQLAQCGFGQINQLLSTQHNGPRSNATARFGIAERCQSQRRLTCPGFSNQSDDLTLRKTQAEALDDRLPNSPNVGLDHKIFNREQVWFHASTLTNVSQI